MNILDLVKSFTADLAEFIKQGAPVVSPKEFEERLNICNDCEHKEGDKVPKCGKCGCYLIVKARMKTTACPINKWEIEEKK
jgi:uncharacterized paraquat-inducible protein A